MAGLADAQSPASVTAPQVTPRRAGYEVRMPLIVGNEGTGRPDAAPAQVGNGARSATATAPLSTTAQGRAVGVSPATGSDRCESDPALAQTELCRRRIESRAAQYDAPAAAPVTAEGRLLMLMTPGASDATAESARRLGEAGPNLQDFVGAAAGQVATALGQPSAGAAPSADPAPHGAPGGLPSTVVINPGR